MRGMLRKIRCWKDVALFLQLSLFLQCQKCECKKKKILFYFPLDKNTVICTLLKWKWIFTSVLQQLLLFILHNRTLLLKKHSFLCFFLLRMKQAFNHLAAALRSSFTLTFNKGCITVLQGELYALFYFKMTLMFYTRGCFLFSAPHTAVMTLQFYFVL